MQERDTLQEQGLTHYYSLNFRKINHPKFSKIYIDVLIRGLLNGLSLSKSCNLAKLKEKDVFDWMDDYDEFNVIIKWARATYEEEILKKVKESATRNPNVALNLLKELRKTEKENDDGDENATDDLLNVLSEFD